MDDQNQTSAASMEEAIPNSQTSAASRGPTAGGHAGSSASAGGPALSSQLHAPYYPPPAPFLSTAPGSAPLAPRGLSGATGGTLPGQKSENLPATEALIEKLRVRQAVLFRVRSVCLRHEERDVLDELLEETSSELAGIHRVLADARGPEHRGAHTENPNPVRAVNGVRAAPFWETRQRFHIEAARVAARERLSRPESESGERGPLHVGGGAS